MINAVFKPINSIYKKELADKAKIHFNQIENYCKKQIEFSYFNSKIYNEDFILNDDKYYEIPNIQIVDTDTVSALFMITGTLASNKGKIKYADTIYIDDIAKDIFTNIGVLNFASYKYPGGMFLKGSAAQEEALCHESILYNVLIKFNDTYYKSNRENSKITGDLYSNRGIFSPDIVFFHNNDNYTYTKANVITVASPNYRNKAIINKNENTKALNSRIKFILDIAKDNNLETLILGAFGCGVFKQNPNEVANIFKYHLLSGKYNFKNIIFAIPYGNNYKEFSKVFENNLFGFFMN